MKLHRDLLMSIGSLVAFNLLVALGGVALLSRMAPAIQHILQDNVASIEVAEKMMGMLAVTSVYPATEAQQAQFAEALQRAERNISEPDEQEVVGRIRAHHQAALRGEAVAIAAAIAALDELVTMNRRAMAVADSKAQRMGTAGAWSAVFIALLGFVASLLVIRRLRRYIVEPLAELYATLEAVSAGDRFRRCTSGDAPPELKRILQVVNQMLDQQERERGHDSDASARMALVYLLEQQPQPAFVVDKRGHLVAANHPGLAQLESDRGESLRQHLARVPTTGSRRFESVELGDGESWYCVLAHARMESEAEVSASSSSSDGRSS